MTCYTKTVEADYISEWSALNAFARLHTDNGLPFH
jgi:hypothetical protein